MSVMIELKLNHELYERSLMNMNELMSLVPDWRKNDRKNCYKPYSLNSSTTNRTLCEINIYHEM
ncbi:hypothetical protein YC2023_058489 [Brassica napus]